MLNLLFFCFTEFRHFKAKIRPKIGLKEHETKNSYSRREFGEAKRELTRKQAQKPDFEEIQGIETRQTRHLKKKTRRRIRFRFSRSSRRMNRLVGSKTFVKSRRCSSDWKRGRFSTSKLERGFFEKRRHFVMMLPVLLPLFLGGFDNTSARVKIRLRVRAGANL